MIPRTRDAVTILTWQWKADVVSLLASGARRYTPLHRQLPVSKKVLTDTLRALERAGIVRREVFAEVPARVEYSLTALGWSLTELLMALYEWANDHFDTVLDARSAHDESHANVAWLSVASDRDR